MPVYEALLATVLIKIPPEAIAQFYNVFIATSLFHITIAALYFKGDRFTRWAMYFVPIVNAIVTVMLLEGILKPKYLTDLALQTIFQSIVPLVVFFMASRTASNRAFFEMEISLDDAKKIWLARSNRNARAAVFVSIFAPLFGIAVIISVLWLGRVELTQTLKVWVTAVVLAASIVAVVYLARKASSDVNLHKLPPIGGMNYIYRAYAMISVWLFLAAAVFAPLFWYLPYWR